MWQQCGCGCSGLPRLELLQVRLKTRCPSGTLVHLMVSSLKQQGCRKCKWLQQRCHGLTGSRQRLVRCLTNEELPEPTDRSLGQCVCNMLVGASL